jgi:hypothetical protein
MRIKDIVKGKRLFAARVTFPDGSTGTVVAVDLAKKIVTVLSKGVERNLSEQEFATTKRLVAGGHAVWLDEERR